VTSRVEQELAGIESIVGHGTPGQPEQDVESNESASGFGAVAVDGGLSNRSVPSQDSVHAEWTDASYPSVGSTPRRDDPSLPDAHVSTPTRLVRFLASARAFKPLIWAGVLVLFHSSIYQFDNPARWANRNLVSVVVYGAIIVAVYYAFGAPDMRFSRVRTFVMLSSAAVASALVMSGLAFVLGQRGFSRWVLLMPHVGIVPWLWIACRIKGHLIAAKQSTDRVLVLSETKSIGDFEGDFDTIKNPCNLIGVKRPSQLISELEDPASVDVDPLLGATIIAVALDAEDVVRRDIDTVSLYERGVRIYRFADFSEVWLGRVQLDQCDELTMMNNQLTSQSTIYRRFTRVLDVVVGSVGLIALGLLALPIMLGNLVSGGGPLFFTQERVGRHGASIRIWKFRTMRVGTNSSEWTQTSDPRITALGGLLRKSHLDEIPQSINLIMGTLTLVGPRPEQTPYVQILQQQLPLYRCRHFVTPGITGWAQVNYPYGASVDDAREKLKLDLYHVRRRTMFLDLRIVGRTIRQLVYSKGR
jgi:lipopolysaccharide/colanic/teichoic acid biosynthesis glycosyltransferase